MKRVGLAVLLGVLSLSPALADSACKNSAVGKMAGHFRVPR